MPGGSAGGNGGKLHWCFGDEEMENFAHTQNH